MPIYEVFMDRVLSFWMQWLEYLWVERYLDWAETDKVVWRKHWFILLVKLATLVPTTVTSLPRPAAHCLFALIAAWNTSAHSPRGRHLEHSCGSNRVGYLVLVGLVGFTKIGATTHTRLMITRLLT